MYIQNIYIKLGWSLIISEKKLLHKYNDHLLELTLPENSFLNKSTLISDLNPANIRKFQKSY